MVSPPIQSNNTESPQNTSLGGFFVDYSKQGEFYQRFGQRLRAEREAAQMTQEEMARLAGINRSYLSQIESGKRHVSLYVACRLAVTLGKTLATLVE